MKIWRTISIILAVLLFVSCDIHKTSQKSKVDTELAESIKTTETRIGDTVHYTVPNIIYRDTTITTYNRQGSALRIVYDNQGKVSDADCFTSAYLKIKEEERKLNQTEKVKDKEKTESLSDRFILYIIGGIVILGMFALFLGFMYWKSKPKIL